MPRTYHDNVYRGVDGCWHIADRPRFYLTRQDAETVAAALQAGFIDDDSDANVTAALKLMARMEAIGVRKS